VTWYAVTDSDWDWDEGTAPPVIVWTDQGMQAAMHLAVQQIQGDADGASLKIASLELRGFCSFTKDDDGRVVYGRFHGANDGQVVVDDTERIDQPEAPPAVAEGMKTPGRRAMSI